MRWTRLLASVLGAGLLVTALPAGPACAQETGAAQSQQAGGATPGALLAWGWNGYGQLGDGTTTDRTMPVPVDLSDLSLPAGTTIKAIAAGENHSLALTSGGQVLAWGWNAYGQLGDGTTTDRTRPVLVDLSDLSLPAGTTITAIAAGGGNSLALTSAGQVLAWGNNYSGQLGDGTTTNATRPVLVDLTHLGLPAGTTITAIAAGSDYSMALTSDGQVLTWGYNGSGQLGDGSSGASASKNRPVLVDMTHLGLPAGTTVTAIGAGLFHGLALTSAGQVLAWGSNYWNQLGDGTTTNANRPVLVDLTHLSLPAGTTITAIAAGGLHNLALTSDKQVLAWGDNIAGQLGDGTNTDRSRPVQANFTGLDLPAGDTVTAIAAGSQHSLALTSGGQVLAWGWNAYGQVGDGTTTSANEPILVSLPGTAVAAVTGSGNYSLASRSLRVTKTASAASFAGTGQEITYTYTVTNYTGEPMTGVAVHDSTFDGQAACTIGTLDPGTSRTCGSPPYTTSGEDVAGGGVINTAYVTGTTTGGPVRTSGYTVTVPWVGHPELSLAKSASTPGFTRAGVRVTYRYTVTSTGNVTVHDVTVTDQHPGLSRVTCPAATLTPGQSVTCTAHYTTTPGDVARGRIIDTATVTANASGTAQAQVQVQARSTLILPFTGSRPRPVRAVPVRPVTRVPVTG